MMNPLDTDVYNAANIDSISPTHTSQQEIQLVEQDNRVIPIVQKDVGTPRTIGKTYPRLALFPSVVLTNQPNGVNEVDGAIVYGIVPGKHPELLPSGATVSQTLDGFQVLGYRDPVLKTYTRGDVTVFPIHQLEGNTFTPFPIPAEPGDTSLEAAARIATSDKWCGVMPFAVTGRVDDNDNIIPNNWTDKKKFFLKSYNLCVAGNNSAADYWIRNIPQLLDYLPNVPVTNHQKFYRPYQGHTGKTFAADDELSQIANLSIQPLPMGVNQHHHIQMTPIGEWFNVVETNYPQTISVNLQRFMVNDPNGTKFARILENSTPVTREKTGIDQQTAQRLRAEKVLMSVQSNALPDYMSTIEWIVANGYRGPTSNQMRQLKEGLYVEPDPTSGNVEGQIKIGTLATPISTNKVDQELAAKITVNGLGPLFATEAAKQEVIEIMATNGGRGPNQQQMQLLVAKYKPKTAPPPPNPAKAHASQASREYASQQLAKAQAEAEMHNQEVFRRLEAARKARPTDTHLMPPPSDVIRDVAEHNARQIAAINAQRDNALVEHAVQQIQRMAPPQTLDIPPVRRKIKPPSNWTGAKEAQLSQKQADSLRVAQTPHAFQTKFRPPPGRKLD